MIQCASLAVDAPLVRETALVYAVPAPAAEHDSPPDIARLEALEEEGVCLAAHIHAADHRFLTLVAEYDP